MLSIFIQIISPALSLILCKHSPYEFMLIQDKSLGRALGAILGRTKHCRYYTHYDILQDVISAKKPAPEKWWWGHSTVDKSTNIGCHPKYHLLNFIASNTLADFSGRSKIETPHCVRDLFTYPSSAMALEFYVYVHVHGHCYVPKKTNLCSILTYSILSFSTVFNTFIIIHDYFLISFLFHVTTSNHPFYRPNCFSYWKTIARFINF